MVLLPLYPSDGSPGFERWLCLTCGASGDGPLPERHALERCAWPDRLYVSPQDFAAYVALTSTTATPPPKV